MVSSIARWIHVWDAETGELKRRIASPHRPGCQLAVSPDGKTLAASDVFADRGKNAIRVYDAESGERLLVLDPGDDRAGVLCFSPNGRKLFSGFHGGTALVWDVGLAGTNGPVSREMRGLAACGSCRRWSKVATREDTMTARRAWWKRVWAVVLASAALQATSICVHAGDAQTQPETPKPAVTVSLLPDRTLLRIGVEDLRTPNWINDIAFSPDGETVAAAVADTTVPRVVFIAVRTGRQVDVLTPPAGPVGAVQSVAYSPDGSKLVWGESSGHVALWEMPMRRLVFREKLHESSVHEVQFSPNGSMLASAGDDDAVRIGRAGNPGALSAAVRARGTESRPSQVS